jgi:voltage-gated potassium channel
VTIAFIFLAEFAIKFFLADSKGKFFKSNWWYLLASIPITTPATQALRLLRLLRLVRLLRLNVGAKEIAEYLKRFIKQTHLVYVFIIWGAIIFTATVAFFVLEHATNPNVHTLFDSFWWAMATVTTIGYGDIYPITTGGRIVAMFLMITGIGTSGIFTALVASFLIKQKAGN